MSIEVIARLERLGQRHQIDSAGGQTTWRRFGDGPSLVLLHGGHGSWLHWARNIPAWAAQCTVLAADMPGYGDSTAPPEPTLASLVDTLRRSLDALVGADTPVSVAGFSFGGLVAAHLASQRSQVSRLILLGPAGHGGPRRPRGELQAWRDARDRGDAAALQAVMRHNLGLHMLADPANADELALHIHTDACLRTRFHSRSISRAGGLAIPLDGFEGPVTLAWGEHDVTATPAALVPRLTQGRPGRRAVIVPDAGHWVQYEAAERVNALVLQALAV